ncbi:MAG: hypothetical protein AVDCRST_MAG76-1151, partial [uncultured Acidimicrobiales bacterium]
GQAHQDQGQAGLGGAGRARRSRRRPVPRGHGGHQGRRRWRSRAGRRGPDPPRERRWSGTARLFRPGCRPGGRPARAKRHRRHLRREPGADRWHRTTDDGVLRSPLVPSLPQGGAAARPCARPHHAPRSRGSHRLHQRAAGRRRLPAVAVAPGPGLAGHGAGGRLRLQRGQRLRPHQLPLLRPARRGRQGRGPRRRREDGGRGRGAAQPGGSQTGL